MSNIDIKKLMCGMTREEKIGQLVQLNAVCFGNSAADITGPRAMVGIPAEYMSRIGSALNFCGPDEMIAIQKEHMEQDRNKIPLMFMMDVIHGYRTIYPIPLALGGSFDPELAAECAKMSARESVAGGIQVTFAPMVDYVRDPRWGRVMESCGEDTLLNCVIGAAQVRAIQGESLSDPDSMATCAKHFAGYGAAEGGRDYNVVEISERLLRERYLPAYKACLDAGARLLMPSFNALNGVPSIANRHLMQDILKNEWGFDGVVISDYNATGELHRHGIAADRKDAAEIAFNNGCDIEMMSSSYCLHLSELIDEGKVSEADLDAAVERVLRLKEELGLFDDPFRGASTEREAELCLCPEHRAIARRAAEESAVLLKNEGVLPFSEGIKSLAIIGPMGDEHAVNGFWRCHGRNEDTVTVAEGIRALLPNCCITVVKGCSADWTSTDTQGFAEAIEAARNAEAVLLCLGEQQDYSGEALSRADLELPGVQNELAAAVAAVNKNTAALIFNGRPLVLTPIAKAVPAILDIYFPGSECGNAAANLLFGRANPCAKVSMSFPKATGQCPVYYDRTNTGRPKSPDKDDIFQPYSSSYIDCGNLALYPFGHGLSYTNFTYEALTLSKTEMSADESITVSVTLRNSGERIGKEVVQLYMRDLVASAVRPVQQLIGFKKISLAAGESATVDFEINESMLRFVNADCKWVSESGEFTVSTGHADHLLLTKSFWLKK